MIWLVIALTAVLTWSDNSDNENGFIVDRNSIVVGYTGVNINSFVDPAAVEGDCYRIAAFNDYGISAWSNLACIPITQPPTCIPRGKSGKCK
jgi:hypothetical protein